MASFQGHKYMASYACRISGLVRKPHNVGIEARLCTSITTRADFLCIADLASDDSDYGVQGSSSVGRSRIFCFADTSNCPSRLGFTEVFGFRDLEHSPYKRLEKDGN